MKVLKWKKHSLSLFTGSNCYCYYSFHQCRTVVLQRQCSLRDSGQGTSLFSVNGQELHLFAPVLWHVVM